MHCVPQFAALEFPGVPLGGLLGAMWWAGGLSVPRTPYLEHGSRTCCSPHPQNHPAQSAGAVPGGSLTAALAKGRRRNPG